MAHYCKAELCSASPAAVLRLAYVLGRRVDNDITQVLRKLVGAERRPLFINDHHASNETATSQKSNRRALNILYNKCHLVKANFQHLISREINGHTFSL